MLSLYIYRRHYSVFAKHPHTHKDSYISTYMLLKLFAFLCSCTWIITLVLTVWDIHNCMHLLKHLLKSKVHLVMTFFVDILHISDLWFAGRFVNIWTAIATSYSNLSVYMQLLDFSFCITLMVKSVRGTIYIHIATIQVSLAYSEEPVD